MFRTKFVEKVKTHLTFNKFFTYSALYDMEKSIVELERPQIKKYDAYALHAGYLRL